MLRRRQINANPGGSSLRSVPAAAARRLRDAAGAAEERLLWPAADLLRGAGEAARWRFERLYWPLEERLLWPLQERADGWSASGRTAGAGALAAVAVAAGALGAVWASGGGDGEEPLAAPVRVAATAPAPQPAAAKPEGPVLQGVAPRFGAGGGVGVGGGQAVDGDGAASASTAPKVAPEKADAAPAVTGDAGDAVASRGKPAPAGPAAMKVARRFAEAFVFYEVGERPGRARTVFEETAAPSLATALSERPPRQPAGGEVPQARVLNLVPGPRSGRTYTVSASLLRVGVTSELRLKMKKLNGAWVVTDVRG